MMGGGCPLCTRIMSIIHEHYVETKSEYISSVFRLDALAKALSVIATATWLGGWLAGWLGVRHTPVLYQNG